MPEQARLVGQIRAVNAAAVELTREGVLPDPELLAGARQVGSTIAIAECQIAVVAALACVGYPSSARQRLAEVRSFVNAGLELDAVWRWRFENCCGLVAEDFGEAGQAWLNHYSALEMAMTMSDQHLVAWSRLNLAKASEKVGLHDEAEELLATLLGAAGAPDGVRMNAHLILAQLVSRVGNDAAAEQHRGKAEALWAVSMPLRYRRMAIETAIWNFDSFPERWAGEHTRSGSALLSEAGNNLGSLEAELLCSRVEFLAGNRDTAIAIAQRAIDRSEQGLAVAAVATFTLATFLNGADEFERALEILDDQ